RRRKSLAMKRSLPVAIIMLVFSAALASGLYLKNRSRAQVDSIAANRWRSPSRSPASAPVGGAKPAYVRGPDTAPVTLEEVADCECPACGQFYPILKSIESEYAGQVRVIFREFPLAQHVHARTAAQAAEAAGIQGKFWEMHDMLYENRGTWTQASDTQPIFQDYA